MAMCLELGVLVALLYWHESLNVPRVYQIPFSPLTENESHRIQF